MPPPSHALFCASYAIRRTSQKPKVVFSLGTTNSRVIVRRTGHHRIAPRYPKPASAPKTYVIVSNIAIVRTGPECLKYVLIIVTDRHLIKATGRLFNVNATSNLVSRFFESRNPQHANISCIFFHPCGTGVPGRSALNRIVK